METEKNSNDSANEEVTVKATQEIENTAKAKKPVYKKPWFWVVVVFALIIIISGSSSTSNDTDSSDDTTNTDITNSDSSEDSSQTSSSEDNATMGEKMALTSAKNYLRTMGFSKQGLIAQLEFEGYTTSEATYAVNNCGANWKEQAVRVAKNYLKTMAFSKQGLIDQLEFEGFTSEEARYGAEEAYK